MVAMRTDLRAQFRDCQNAVAQVYRGNPGAVRLALLTILARGHLLIEDVPGIGKTTLALALARVLKLDFRRVQMTADLLPADLIGVSVYDPKNQAFVFHAGPIFTQVLLVDELNRATPKTQSALLEAMAEGAVSVDGLPRPLPQPYVVLATQNPIEQVGTFPLPESQLDRFLMRVRLGYPDLDDETAMLQAQRYGTRPPDIAPAIDGPGVLAAREEVATVNLHPEVARYVTEVVRSTRRSDELLLGASPRGSLALAQAARAAAWLDGRDFATPDDVYQLAVPVLAHRVLPRGTEGDAGALTAVQESLLTRIIDDVPAPV